MPVQTTKAPRISVIIPCLNEGDVIGEVIKKTQSAVKKIERNSEILVINDGSTDNTSAVARAAGATVVEHPYNIGYGAAIKTGIRHARGSILITLDSDGQHDPNDIQKLVEKIGLYDMVVGSRSRQSDTETHRDLANMGFNSFASYVSGRKIEDLTSGFRAIKAHIARQFLYLLPNTFSCSSTLTLSTVRAGYSLCYVPIQVARRRGKGKSKIKPLQDGMRFLFLILKIAVFYAPLKIFIPTSLAMFIVGLGYGLLRMLAWGVRYGQTSALLMSTAVLIFMVGLVSEQIAQLRFDRSESNTRIPTDE